MFGDMKQLSLKMIKSLRLHLQASIRVPAFPSAAIPASCEQSASSIYSYVLAVPSTSSKHPASYVLAVYPAQKTAALLLA